MAARMAACTPGMRWQAVETKVAHKLRLTATEQALWDAYQLLMFPLRFMLGMADVMGILLHAAENNYILGQNSTPQQLLRSLPQMLWSDMLDALQQLRAYGTAWRLRFFGHAPDKVIKAMKQAGWLQPHPNISYNWKANQTPNLRLVLATDTARGVQCDLLVLNSTTYLHQHMVNDHHRVVDLNSYGEVAADQSQPIMMFGRQHEFLCGKVGKKDGDRKVKEYQVVLYATKSFCQGDHVLPGPTIRNTTTTPRLGSFVPSSFDEVHMRLGASSTIGNEGKLEARRALYLSKIYILPGAFRLLFTDDIVNEGPDGQKGDAMTDGAGLVSMDVAESCPRVDAGVVKEVKEGKAYLSPLQVRVFAHDLFVIKGLLIPWNHLPERTIVVPWSMVKTPAEIKTYVGSLLKRNAELSKLLRREVYQADTATLQKLWEGAEQPSHPLHRLYLAYEAAGVQGHKLPATGQLLRCCAVAPWAEDVITVGVVKSCFTSSEMRLNKEMIKLLHDGGVPMDFFKGLMEPAVENLKNIGTEVELTCTAAAQAGNRELDLALRAGFPLESLCCYLRDALRRVQQWHARQALLLKLPLPDALRCVGIPDPTGTIPPGCVVISHRETIVANRPVLIYRNPGLLPTDVQMAIAIPASQELRDALYNDQRMPMQAIIFSTQGCRCLAQLIAGGDFDGDEYCAVWHPEVVKTFVPYIPPASTSSACKQEVRDSPSHTVSRSEERTVACMAQVRVQSPSQPQKRTGASSPAVNLHAGRQQLFPGVTTTAAVSQSATILSARPEARRAVSNVPDVLPAWSPSVELVTRTVLPGAGAVVVSVRQPGVQAKALGGPELEAAKCTPLPAEAQWQSSGSAAQDVSSSFSLLTVHPHGRVGSAVPCASTQACVQEVRHAAQTARSQQTQQQEREQHRRRAEEVEHLGRQLFKTSVPRERMEQEYQRNGLINQNIGKVTHVWQRTSTLLGRVGRQNKGQAGSRHPAAIEVAKLHAEVMDAKKHGSSLQSVQQSLIDVLGYDIWNKSKSFRFEKDEQIQKVVCGELRVPHVEGGPGGVAVALMAMVPVFPEPANRKYPKAQQGSSPKAKQHAQGYDQEWYTVKDYNLDPDLHKLFKEANNSDPELVKAYRSQWELLWGKWRSFWGSSLAKDAKHKRDRVVDEAMKEGLNKLLQEAKDMLYGANCWGLKKEQDVSVRALALYQAVYTERQRQIWATNEARSVAYVWYVAGERLLELKAKATHAGRLPADLHDDLQRYGKALGSASWVEVGEYEDWD